MDKKNLFKAWFTEFIERFALESPKYFQVWQKIGGIAFIIGWVPDALDALDIVVTGKIADYIAFGLKVAGFITWLQAKQPVLSFTKPTIKGEVVDTKEVMPFSSLNQNTQYGPDKK